MIWPSHKCLYFNGRPLWVVAAYTLVLIVVLAQPLASLAWLGGAHATIEQATLHEEATEHGHYHHHGALKHHEQRPSGGAGNSEGQTSLTTPGPGFPSVPHHSGRVS